MTHEIGPKNTNLVSGDYITKHYRPSAKPTISARVAAAFPDVYHIAGVGWCGPQWREAQALEGVLRREETR